MVHSASDDIKVAKLKHRKRTKDNYPYSSVSDVQPPVTNDLLEVEVNNVNLNETIQ
ncbi:MAG: hypothetical protein ACKO96_14790 [Flammeovirgaceae bacterium]